MRNWLIGLAKSKTFWTALGMGALAAFDGPVQKWIAAHPGWAGSVAMGVMVFLRAITTTSLVDKGAPK